MISMIAGMAHNRVIGNSNQLPWHLPADLRWFKKTTLGKPLIMGRKTHESIGVPLPGRQNIVISTQTGLSIAGCDVVNSSKAAIALAKTGGDKEIMVIGGAQIYALFLPLAQRLYLTQIDAEIEGDAFFPDYQAQSDWTLTFLEEHAADAHHTYAFSFQQLDRVG